MRRHPAPAGRLRGQRGPRALLSLPPPLREVRAVQPLAPEQGPDLAGLRAGVGFPQDADLVLRGEPAPLGLLRHLWVGPDGRRQQSARDLERRRFKRSFLGTARGVLPQTDAEDRPADRLSPEGRSGQGRREAREEGRVAASR